MEMGRRGGDAERAGPIPRVWRLRMGRGISAAEVTTEERGVPAWDNSAGNTSPRDI